MANRHSVVFNLDPINPDQPFLAFEMPFFVFLFITLLTGLLIGSIYTWFSQSRYRKMARENRREAEKWHREADEQKERAIQAMTPLTEGDNKSQSTGKTLPAPHQAA